MEPGTAEGELRPAREFRPALILNAAAVCRLRRVTSACVILPALLAWGAPGTVVERKVIGASPAARQLVRLERC